MRTAPPGRVLLGYLLALVTFICAAALTGRHLANVDVSSGETLRAQLLILLLGAGLAILLLVVSGIFHIRKIMDSAQSGEEHREAEHVIRSADVEESRFERRVIQAIMRAQAGFIKEEDVQSLYGDLLLDIISLSGAKSGFIGERADGSGPGVLRLLSLRDDRPERFFDAVPREVLGLGVPLSEINPSVSKVLERGETAFTKEIPFLFREKDGSPESPDAAFLGLPLISREQVIGMVGLVGTEDHFDPSLPNRIQPLLSTCATLIEANRSEQYRRESEEDLRDSEARVRAILDNVLDGIITIDEEGMVEIFNPAAERIFGYDAGEVVGGSVNLLVPSPHGEKHDRYIRNYLETGHAKIIGIGRKTEGKRKDGSIFPLELAVSEILLGSRRKFVGIVRDITEQVKVERLKSEFVSIVSHELRTPLTSIQGSLGLLSGGAAGELPAESQSLIDIALKNAGRLVTLVNDILDADKIESGMMEFRIRPIDLTTLVAQSVDANRGYAAQFKVGLEMTETRSGTMVQADGERIMQVMANLISNAVKYSPAGGTVRVSLLREEGSARVSVSDGGAGIPQEHRAMVFQRFSQVDSSDARSKGGTGLGLNICKAMVEHMKGRIDFDSKKGEGTTFYFELPIWKGSSRPGVTEEGEG